MDFSCTMNEIHNVGTYARKNSLLDIDNMYVNESHHHDIHNI